MKEKERVSLKREMIVLDEVKRKRKMFMKGVI